MRERRVVGSGKDTDTPLRTTEALRELPSLSWGFKFQATSHASDWRDETAEGSTACANLGHLRGKRSILSDEDVDDGKHPRQAERWK